LHCDVKPANILISASDDRPRILLADFGIGREIGHTSGLTATNMTMGNRQLRSPGAVDG
jgi:serine/threonine-protein kinase